jgi:hypothetical protein
MTNQSQNPPMSSIRNALASAAALLLVTLPLRVARSQDARLELTQFPLVAPASLTASLPDSGRAQKTLFTRHDLIPIAGAAVATGVTAIFDKRIAAWFQSPHVQGSNSFNHDIGQLTRINETPLAIASILTYGVGRLAHSQTTADVGLHWTQALLLTDVISEVIRGPVGRARPRVSMDDPFKFQFGAGFTKFENRSWPSLHAAVGFATAASLLEELQVHSPSSVKYAVVPLYAFAMVPGLTRMYLNQHWASDVVAGAFIGQFLGHRVVHYAHTHKRTKLDRALLATSVMPGGYGNAIVSIDVQKLFSSNDH